MNFNRMKVEGKNDFMKIAEDGWNNLEKIIGAESDSTVYDIKRTAQSTKFKKDKKISSKTPKNVEEKKE